MNLKQRAEDVLTLLQQIKAILEEQGENNWIRGINAAIDAIEPSVDAHQSLKAALLDAKSIYHTMHGGPGSFSDFSIWRNDFEQRVAINRNLSQIRDKLWDLLEEVE